MLWRRAPGDINIEMVMTSLEGKGEPLGCLEDPAECTLSGACAQREGWQVVGDTVTNVLRSITIGDLVVKQQQMSRRGMYYI